MQYLVSNTGNGTIEYKIQNDKNKCKDSYIMCNNTKKICETRNISCNNSNITCEGKHISTENYEFVKESRNITYYKGNELHQVIMGASGSNLDDLCLNLTSPMADLIYGLTDYGFLEVTVSEIEMNMKYIHANSSKIVFESTIVV